MVVEMPRILLWLYIAHTRSIDGSGNATYLIVVVHNTYEAYRWQWKCHVTYCRCT